MQAAFQCSFLPISFLLRLAITLKVHVPRLRGWWRGSDQQKKTSKPPVALQWKDTCIYRRNVRYTEIMFSPLALSLYLTYAVKKIQLNSTFGKTCVMCHRSIGQCVDQILLYLRKKLQDVHHEQHWGQTSQQTGERAAKVNNHTGILKYFSPFTKNHDPLKFTQKTNLYKPDLHYCHTLM